MSKSIHVHYTAHLVLFTYMSSSSVPRPTASLDSLIQLVSECTINTCVYMYTPTYLILTFYIFECMLKSHHSCCILIDCRPQQCAHTIVYHIATVITHIITYL